MSQEVKIEDLIAVNGLDATTGDYVDEPWSPDDGTAAAFKEKPDPELSRAERDRVRQGEEAFAPEWGIDPSNLQDTGWGVLFAENLDPEVKGALQPLLDWRHHRAGDGRYGEYEFKEGQTWEEFAFFHKLGEGPANPDELPYYMLLVGDPEAIPYRFQYQLDVQRAVGRIWFDTPDEYARYAQSVVQAEEGKVRLPRQATLFGVLNNDDLSTERSVEYLIDPLAGELASVKGWTVDSVPHGEAMKARLVPLVGGADTPALLFTAGHGAHFHPVSDAERHRLHEGALICGDWPGRLEWRKRIPREWYLHPADLGDEARLWGSIAIFFACFGAGTPRFNDFYHRSTPQRPEPLQLSRNATVAPLPRRMLSHPNGGALAVVGHVDRAFDSSFRKSGLLGEGASDLASFRSLMRALMFGVPIGHAMDYVNVRCASMGSQLVNELYKVQHHKDPDKAKISSLWTANHDARNYVIVGDPAVCLPLCPEGEEPPAQRPAIDYVPVQERPYEIADSTKSALEVPHEIEPEALEVDFGVFDLLRGKEGEPSALRQFIEKVAGSLQTAVSKATTLEVTTYVSDEMGGVTYDRQTRTLTNAQLRALTVISLDGDVLACVPQAGGKVDADLWALHLQLVDSAQTNRNELFRIAISAVTGLVRPGAM